MSRTNRYLSGLAGTILNQGVVLLLGLWLARFLLDRLGADDYGRWLIITQVLILLELADLGVMAVLPREVAYRTGLEGDEAARNARLRDLLSGARRVSLWQLPVVAVAGAGLWLYLTGGRPDDPAALPLAAIVLCYVALFPLRLYNATLLGMQDLLFAGLTNTAGWLTQAAVTAGMILAGAGIGALAAGWVAGRCVVALVGWWRVRSRFRGIVPRRVLGRWMPDIPALLIGGVWVSVANLAVALHYSVDVLILGQMLGPAPVVVYSCTMKVVTLCTFQIVGLVTVAGPALSELRESGGEHLMRASTALGQLILLASGLACCLILVLNQGFVTWWVGAGRYGGLTLTALLLAVMLLQHFVFVLSHVLFCLGRERAVALVVLGGGSVTVASTIALTPWLGLLAAPAGCLLGVGLVSLPSFLALLAREPQFSLAVFLRGYLPWAVRFAGLTAALGWLATGWTPDGLLQLVLAAIGIVALYGAVMLPALVHMPVWVYLRPRLEAARRLLQTRPARPG